MVKIPHRKSKPTEQDQTRFKDGIDDSFRNYMHRKVELQRKQFGLVLPPSPSSNFQEKYSSKKSQLNGCGNETLENLKNTSPGFNGGGNNKTKRKDLFFSGVVVMVNGYTNPDTPTIMRLLHKHGGDLEKYETRRITHIIAEQLSTAKANIYKKQRNPIPIVYPSWIVDCIKQGKRLAHGDYLINEIKNKDAGSLKKSFCVISKRSVENDTKQPFINSKPTEPPNNFHKVRTVGTDPNFLDAYFSTSRLSFIGSYRQRSVQSSSNSKDISDNHHRLETPTENSTKFVFHVDMDCFFASVVLRNFPQYKDCPVAIGHNNIISNHNPSGNTSNSRTPTSAYHKRSTCELSTCNYIAREFGIRKGMWLHQATELCPNLIVLPYDYDGYEQVSNQVMDILFSYANSYHGFVELVSCDEAYMELHIPNPKAPPDQNKSIDVKTSALVLSEYTTSIAEEIRKEIYSTTQCTASIGCASNKFLSKLATDKAKPDGSFVIVDDEWKQFLKDLRLRDLPGIGYKLEKKLTFHQLLTVQDIWDLGDDAENELCQILGKGNGKKILQFCQGKDSRAVAPVPRKTIGAECNYGVRFDGPYGVDYMIIGLAKEVEKRMKGENVQGRNITLKIKQRKKGALEPSKFNGHGPCNNISKSEDISGQFPTWDHKIITKMALSLFEDLQIDKDQIRGMGIVMSKLEEPNSCSRNQKESNISNGMSEWLSRTKPSKQLNNINNDLDTSMQLKDKKFEEFVEESNCNVPHKLETDELEMIASPIDVDNIANFEAFDSLIPNQDKKRASIPNSITFENKNFNQNKDASLDIQIPNPSQIDKDVLQFLPKNIQEEISKKLKQKEREKIRENEFSALRNNFSEKSPNMFALSNKKRRIAFSKEVESSRRGFIKSRHTSKKEKGPSNMRQISVKRMLKLASVKSGQDKIEGIEDISMTQLGALPLKIQLQVVNNDENQMVSNRREKFKKSKTKPVAKKPAMMNKHEAVKVHEYKMTIPKQNEALRGGQKFSSDVEEIDVEEYEESDYNVKYNIIPLSEFLGSVSTPSSDDIEKVQRFFQIVLDENRIDEVISMLRHIKNRKDVWSLKPLDSFIKYVENAAYGASSLTLDLVWLGLK